MGCSGSSSDVGSANSILTNKKPSVWLIGGGPGCEKGKICDYLIRDYKFKYLSSYDMVQFEQQRGGPDAELILQLFKEKKKMPSDLIVRLVKKAIASCGVRRFLIDGFPNSVEDVSQFDKELTQRQIDFYGYLYIEISEQKMIKSGIEANSNDKSKSKAEIEDNVKQIVQTYLKESQKIKQVYIRNKKYHEINGEQGAEKCYEQVKQYFESEGVQPPTPVKVFFSHFDNEAHQIKLCDDFVRKYGFYFYTPKSLIEEAVAKGNSPESQSIMKLQKDNKQIPPALVLALMRKKIQKHDCRGNFLISGYPRTVSDAQEWEKYFGWETDVLGYITFQIPDESFRKIFNDKMLKYKPNLKQEQLAKQFSNYQNNQKQICKYYEEREKLMTVNAEDEKKAVSDVHSFLISRKMLARNKINSKKLVFVSTLNGSGDICVQAAKKKGASIIDMDALFQQKIKQNGLYSQLIQSFIKIGKPVSGIVAVRTLLQRISLQSQSNLILISGFPNSEQQIQCWEEEVGDAMTLNLIMFFSDNTKYIEQSLQDKIKNQKVTAQGKDVVALLKQSSSRMSQRLKLSDWRVHQVKPLDSSTIIEQALNKADFK